MAVDEYGTYNELYIQQGDDRPVTWDLAINGVAVDSDGYTGRAMVRADYDSTVILHEWSTTLGNLTFDGATVNLVVTDSEEWDWYYGKYDVIVTPPDNIDQVIDRGQVFVIPLVTHDN